MLADNHSIVAPLPWQEDFWSRLLQRREDDQLPHGLLLRGPEGTGKAQFALALSQYLLCNDPKGNVACGRCKSCQLLKAASHPDLLLVEPEEAGKAIRIEQIRRILDFAGKSPQYGGYRVVLICPAEAMNVNASNALLKCLEEPGRDTLLILVTHQITGLLATIRSRCQSLDFPIPDTGHTLPWLTNLVSDEAKARQLLQVANGAPVKAMQLSDRDWLKERDLIVRSWIAVYEGKQDPVKAAELWQSYDLVEVITWLLAWQIDFNRYCAAGEHTVVNRDLLPFFQQMQRQVAPERSHRLYDYLQSLLGMLKSQANPNLQLLVEELLIRWSQMRP
ncbi:MAG: DNA polymerase III subunit delta' [Ketobacteraceae bacterium]|nr:DNA polymerase III subunit delta' [Ketobacteraceae bacterium]